MAYYFILDGHIIFDDAIPHAPDYCIGRCDKKGIAHLYKLFKLEKAVRFSKLRRKSGIFAVNIIKTCDLNIVVFEVSADGNADLACADNSNKNSIFTALILKTLHLQFFCSVVEYYQSEKR